MSTETRPALRPADESSPGTDRLDARTKTVIGLLLVSSFVVILNETIMSVALPRLMADLQITAATAQWLTTGFMLTMCSLRDDYPDFIEVLEV